MKILLFGANGQLGITLKPYLNELGSLLSLSRKELDLSQLDKVKEIIRHYRPNIIVNAAAYTEVESAENDKSQAHLINALVPAVIAEEAKRHNAFLIHYSTDYVFDGEKSSPYVENDEPSQCNMYGESKRKGEMRIENIGCHSVILRVSWLFSPYGKNFLKSILSLADEREIIQIVNDQFGTPTSTALVSTITSKIIRHKKTFNGIYHLTGKGETNWAEFGAYIIESARKIGLINQDNRTLIEKISSEMYPPIAKRPSYSVLNTDKITRKLNLILPHWKTLVDQTIGKILNDENKKYAIT